MDMDFRVGLARVALRGRGDLMDDWFAFEYRGIALMEMHLQVEPRLETKGLPEQ